MLKTFKITFFILSVILLSTACEKDEEQQARIDDELIQKYLEEQNIDAKKHSSGLYFKILKEGTGTNPNPYSSVAVYYKGYFTDGEIFDQTGSERASFSLMNVIEGWQIGIPLIREGGKGIFFIPSGLGYGSSQKGSIPANSVLIFEVDLLTVY